MGWLACFYDQLLLLHTCNVILGITMLHRWGMLLGKLIKYRCVKHRMSTAQSRDAERRGASSDDRCCIFSTHTIHLYPTVASVNAAAGALQDLTACNAS